MPGSFFPPSLPPSPKKITQGGEGGLGLNTREDPNKGWLWGFGSVLKMTLLKKNNNKKITFSILNTCKKTKKKEEDMVFLQAYINIY